MSLSSQELIQAREVASSLLEELSLNTYLFKVEPHEEHYELKVECACSSDGEWASTSILIPKSIMLGGADDPASKTRMLEQLNKKLAVCKRQTRYIGKGTQVSR